MERISMFLTQLGTVLSECAEQITELSELGFVLTIHEQKLVELQRKLERAPDSKMTEERARELFLRAGELQSALIAEEYRYYISAVTESGMMTRTHNLEPDLRAEARRAVREYQKARIPRANPITLRKAHDVAEEMVSWAEEQTTRIRFERKFKCRLPSKGRGGQVAQAS